MKQIKHWQDSVNGVLGAALILSPWMAGYFDSTPATANAVLVGIALMATTLGAMLAPKVWEEWTEAALGLWLMLSPWVLGYSMVQSAMFVAAFGGLAVLVLSLWTLATDKAFHLPRSIQP